MWRVTSLDDNPDCEGKEEPGQRGELNNSVVPALI